MNPLLLAPRSVMGGGGYYIYFAKQAPWIVLSAFGARVMVLTLVTFIGEAVREAFDPKKFTTYE